MQRIKELKKLYNLTQADLAKVLDTNRVQISRYETGERELRAEQIIKLCKQYKVSADWLLGIEDTEKSNATKYRIWSASNMQRGYPACF